MTSKSTSSRIQSLEFQTHIPNATGQFFKRYFIRLNIPKPNLDSYYSQNQPSLLAYHSKWWLHSSSTKPKHQSHDWVWNLIYKRSRNFHGFTFKIYSEFHHLLLPVQSHLVPVSNFPRLKYQNSLLNWFPCFFPCHLSSILNTAIRVIYLKS